MTKRTSLAALAATCTAIALPAAAQAGEIPRIDYAVTIAGTADYNRADADAEVSAQHDATIDFRTEIPRFSFFGDVAEDSRGALGTASVRRASYVITGPSASVRCHANDIADVAGGGLDATPQPGRNVFAARVIDSFNLRLGGCDLGALEGSGFAFGSGGHEVGVGIWDGSFTIPDSRVGEASMTFPLKGEVTGAECPGHHFNTALCSLTWDATVTFKRVGEGLESDEVVPVPIVPDPGKPAPTPAPDPKPAPAVDPDDDLLIPLMAKASMPRSLGRASIPFTCATACRGTLVATAKGKAKPLAKTAFSVAAGRSKRAVVRFDAADRRAIRRARGVRLTLTARPTTKDGGDAVRRTVILRAR